jgi:hypothetical protein
VEIRAKLESGDLEMLGQVGPLDTPSKTFDLFYQFESPVKMSEVCSKYEQMGQLVGVQTQRLVALLESGTNDDYLKQYDVVYTMEDFLSVDALLSWMKKDKPGAALFNLTVERMGVSDASNGTPAQPASTCCANKLSHFTMSRKKGKWA